MIPNTKSGGSGPMTLKKLKGAALRAPSRDKVVTQAIGRGVTEDASTL
jgi:hypothetical protein